MQLTKHFDQRLLNVTLCRQKNNMIYSHDPSNHTLRSQTWDLLTVSSHFAQDYFTDSNRKVHKDPLQSYELLYGKENDTHTVLAFSRNLQTCDDNDKVITVGLTTCIITSDSRTMSETAFGGRVSLSNFWIVHQTKDFFYFYFFNWAPRCNYNFSTLQFIQGETIVQYSFIDKLKWPWNQNRGYVQ